MFKSSIVDILKSFSKEEIKEFGVLVRSPFFSTSKSAVKLFDQLRLYYPEFSNPRLDKKIIFRDVFGKAKYNGNLLRVLSSKLTKLAKDYLILVYSRNNSMNQKMFLLYELNVRKLEKQFKLARRETEEYLKTLPKTDMMYFLNKSFLDDNIYLFNQWGGSRTGKNSLHSEVESLKNIIDDITRYYLIACLLMIRKIIASDKLAKIEIDFPFTLDILKVLDSRIENFSDTPIISLHLNEILLITKGNRKYFKLLKDIFMRDSEQYDIIINYSLHYILQKYSDKQILKGKYAYKREKLILYKEAMRKNILINPFIKYFGQSIFLSVVNEAADLDEIIFAENFIKEYQQYLDTKTKDGVIDIANAIIACSRKEYKEALKLLNSVKIKIPEVLMIIKIMLLKIYFELNMFIEAYMVIDTLRHLLKTSQQFSDESMRESCRNFLTVYSTLLRSKEKEKAELAFDAVKLIKSNGLIRDYWWLKEKAGELM